MRARACGCLDGSPGSAADVVVQEADDEVHVDVSEAEPVHGGELSVIERGQLRAQERPAGSDLQEPWVGQQERPVLFAECGKRGPPGPGGEVADRDLGVGAVGHDVKQFGFAGHVAVEGHGGDAQFVSEPAHRQPAEPIPVGDLGRRGHDLVAAQAGLGSPAATLHPPQQVDGALGVSAAAVLGGQIPVRPCPRTPYSVQCLKLPTP